MTGGEALQAEWERVVPDPPALSSVLLMISYLGGTTKVAKLLQKNAGSVRRYKSYEEYGKRTGNRRMPDNERRFLRSIIRAEVDRRAIERIRKGGLGGDTTIRGTFTVSKRPWTGTIYDLTGDGWEPDNDEHDIADFCKALSGYEWETAFDHLQDWLFDAYGIPGNRFTDVENVTLDMPR